MSDLSVLDLTFRQIALANEAIRFPVIVSGKRKADATRMERKGWGWVEHGAPGERIFRLSTAGLEALRRVYQQARA